jgi:hypothetical protein
METLATVAYKEFKKTGAFLTPGFAKRSRAANSYAFSPTVRRRRGDRMSPASACMLPHVLKRLLARLGRADHRWAGYDRSLG